MNLAYILKHELLTVSLTLAEMDRTVESGRRRPVQCTKIVVAVGSPQNSKCKFFENLQCFL